MQVKPGLSLIFERLAVQINHRCIGWHFSQTANDVLLVDDWQENWEEKVMSNLFKLRWLMISTTAAMMFVPSNTRADLLFVGDDGSSSLYEFDTEVGESSMVIYSDELHKVNGLTSDGKGNLFVSDYGTRSIIKFTPDGNYDTFAQLDSSGGGLIFDSEGNLFVPFQWAGRIDKLSPDGHTDTVFATNQGAPVQLAFDKLGELFAADQKSGNVSKFDPDGTQTTFATGLKANALTFDSHGTLFVGGRNTIYKFAPDGTRTIFARGVKSPSGLAFDSRGNLFSSDGGGNVYEFKNTAGNLAVRPALFAKGLGHDYFIAILPGSISSPGLLSKSLSSSWILWLLVLLVLLAAGAGCGFWLRRKKRRASLESN